MTRVRAVLFAVAVTTVATAHIGSPNVLFDGTAGPYPVRVIVRPPSVVPGLAEVIVRTTAADVQSIIIQPVFWRTGVAGAPRGDEMARVAGQAGTYTGQLWLMARGSYSVYVTAHGARGDGRAIVPVNSIATGLRIARYALVSWMLRRSIPPDESTDASTAGGRNIDRR